MTTDLNIGVLAPGYQLHWYTIERVLGRGGFGITYLAIDGNLEQRVALKEFFPSELVTRGDDLSVQPKSESVAIEYENWLSRFLTEARTLARFDHPNIVRCYSIFESNNTAYMVMRYEQGEPLSDILNRNEAPSEKMLLGVALPILDGLGKVHELGFVHRDCQPANIYIRADGSPVLLDFGAARESSDYQTVTILVAPGYAPFEQYYSNRAEQGPWTDIYALGATLYRAIAGVAPIDAIERSRGMLGSARDVLMPATVAGADRYSEQFLSAIDHALAFREAERPQSAAEWAAELRGEVPVPRREKNHSDTDVAVHGEANSDVGIMPTTSKSNVIVEAETEEKLPAKTFLSVPAMVAIIVFGIACGVVVLELLRPVLNADTSGDDEKLRALEQAVATKEIRNTSLQAELAALRERELEARAAEEQAAKEQAAKEQAAKEQVAKEQAAKEQAAKEQAAKEQAAKEQAAKEQAAKEQAAKEQAAKEQAAKEQAAKEQAAKEQAAKEQAAKEQAAKEQAAKEQAAKEQAAKEQAAKEQAANDRKAGAAAAGREKQGGATREPDKLQQALALVRAREFVSANAALAPLAEQGDPEAQYHLGRLFREGRGVVANDSAAFKWTSSAARQGHADAQIELARLHAHGVNGVRDYFLAYTWFLVAERNGVNQYETEREAAGAHLQIEQLAQASALATQIAGRQRYNTPDERRGIR